MESPKIAIVLNPTLSLISTLTERLASWGIAALVLLSPAVSTLNGASVTLAWDPSQDAVVIGYTVRYGTNSGQYSDFVIVEQSTTATLSGLSEGVSYFFAVSAFTPSGIESDPSEEIQYTIPSTGPVGNQPTLNPIDNLVLNEDASLQSVSLSGITAGLGGILQLLGITVTATSSNPSLIPHPTVSYTSPSTTGTLWFTPVSNASGSAVITVTINNFKLVDNLFSRSFTVSVNQINDAPSLNALNNLTVIQNSGSRTVTLTGINSGAPDETQPLVVTATSSNPILVPDPTVSYATGSSSGTLVLTPLPDVSGTATITVTLNDGQNQNNTFSRSFSVTVTILSANPIYVEAESGTIASPMLTVADSNASNGGYVQTLSDYQGTLSLRVNVPQPGNYLVWCRVLSTDSGKDSFFVSVDGGTEEIYNAAQNSWSAAWQWSAVNAGVSTEPRVFFLSQGQHTFVFRGGESSTKLDALYITTDRSFTPIKAPALTISRVSTPSQGTRISFQASAGACYDLLASEDLISWTSLWYSSVTTANQLRNIIDSTQTSAGKRFYRLQVR